MDKTKTVAFAIGGLAGNNAHGAGFLEAALQKRINPLMISCTSGQILWVSRYLRLHNAAQTSGLNTELEHDIAAVNEYHNKDFDWLKLALVGKKDVFKPASEEYFIDAWRNTAESFANIWRDKENTFLFRRYLELFPCRVLVSDFRDDFFVNISKQFTEETKIGIAFNSYSPSTGMEYVYLNEKARELLNSKSKDREKRYLHDQPSTYQDRTIYKDITPQAVRDALRLYQYGFDGNAEVSIDGAYYRDIILGELTPAETIYVVRPMHFHWSGDMPRNVPQMEDFKTKLGFNGAYVGERYQILLINRMLAAQRLNNNRYHEIKLIEFEMEKARSFFDYVFEDKSVFDDAYNRAQTYFSQDGVTQLEKSGPDLVSED